MLRQGEGKQKYFLNEPEGRRGLVPEERRGLRPTSPPRVLSPEPWVHSEPSPHLHTPLTRWPPHSSSFGHERTPLMARPHHCTLQPLPSPITLPQATPQPSPLPHSRTLLCHLSPVSLRAGTQLLLLPPAPLLGVSAQRPNVTNACSCCPQKYPLMTRGVDKSEPAPFSASPRLGWPTYV